MHSWSAVLVSSANSMGLTALESRALTNHRSTLLSGIEPSDVIDYLYSYELVNQTQFEEIKSLPTRLKKCVALLDIVQRFRSEHYALFVRVLEKTKQGHLAKLLRPSASHYGPAPESEPPTSSKSSDVLSCRIYAGKSFGSDYCHLQQQQPAECLDFGNSTAILKIDIRPCTDPAVVSLLSQRSGCRSSGAAAFYRMTRPSRGRALLLCNTAFAAGTELAPRPSADNDAANVSRLLGALGFSVRLVRNASREELVHAIDAERREAVHADLGAFVLYVSSHGEEGAVYGTDGRRLLLEDVYEALDGRGCPLLSGKPKLIIVEASQGHLLDRAVVTVPPVAVVNPLLHASGDEESADARKDGTGFGDSNATSMAPKLAAVAAATAVVYPNVSLQLKRFSIPAAPAVCGFVPLAAAVASRMPSPLPTKADFVVALSAFPGYASFRHQEHGCWFSRALVEAFAKHACDEHVTQLLRRVRRMVLQAETDLGYKQVCITHDTLLKNFYLFPEVGIPIAES